MYHGVFKSQCTVYWFTSPLRIYLLLYIYHLQGCKIWRSWTLRRVVFLHGISLLYMIHLSIQPSLTTKKASWGLFYLDPPHESMNLHRSCIQFDVTLQLAETDLLRTLSKRSDWSSIFKIYFWSTCLHKEMIKT